MSRSVEPAASFPALYQALSTKVFTLCFRMLGTRCAAEDAVQETFCAVLQALPGFRGESLPSTWVYRIAVRMVMRIKAREGRSEASSGVEFDVPDAGPSPDAVAAARQEAARVLSALDQLSFEHRLTIALSAIDGVSHREIAETLGIPEGTVGSRLHAARRELLSRCETPTRDA